MTKETDPQVPELSAWMSYPSTTTESIPDSALYRGEEIGLGRGMSRWASNLDHAHRAKLADEATHKMHRLIQSEDPLEDHSAAREPYWLIEVLRSSGMFPMTDVELSDYLTVRDTYITWRKEQCETMHSGWRHAFWQRLMKTEPAKEYNP